MFTVETEYDYTKVTVMDDTGGHEDMIVRFAEEGIYLSQWNEKLNSYQTLWINEKMLDEFLISLQSEDGTFLTR